MIMNFLILYITWILSSYIQPTPEKKLLFQYERILMDKINEKKYAKLKVRNISDPVVISFKNYNIHIRSENKRITLELTDYMSPEKVEELFVDILHSVYSLRSGINEKTFIIEGSYIIKTYFMELYNFLLRIETPPKKIIERFKSKYNITYFNYEFITFSSIFDNLIPSPLYKADDLPDLRVFQYHDFIVLRFPVQDYFYFFRISLYEINYNELVQKYSNINVAEYDKNLSTFVRSTEFCNLHYLLIDKMSTPYNHSLESESDILSNLSSLENNQMDIRRPKHNLLTIRKSFYENLSNFYRQNSEHISFYNIFSTDNTISINNINYTTNLSDKIGIYVNDRIRLELVSYFKYLQSLSNMESTKLDFTFRLITNSNILRQIFERILSDRNNTKYIILLQLLRMAEFIDESQFSYVANNNTSHNWIEKLYSFELQSIINSSEDFDWGKHTRQVFYLKYFIYEEFKELQKLANSNYCSNNCSLSGTLKQYLRDFNELISTENKIESVAMKIKEAIMMTNAYYLRYPDTYGLQFYSTSNLQKNIRLYHTKHNITNMEFDRVNRSLLNSIEYDIDGPLKMNRYNFD